jgi:hypothetical protein
MKTFDGAGMYFILIVFLGERCSVNFRQKRSSTTHLLGVGVNLIFWSRHDGEDPLYTTGIRTLGCPGCSQSMYSRTSCQFRLLFLCEPVKLVRELYFRSEVK